MALKLFTRKPATPDYVSQWNALRETFPRGSEIFIAPDGDWSRACHATVVIVPSADELLAVIDTPWGDFRRRVNLSRHAVCTAAEYFEWLGA